MGHILESILYAIVFLPTMLILAGLKKVSEFFQKRGEAGKVIGFIVYVISLPFDFIIKRFK